MLAEHIIEPEFLIKIAESRRNFTDFIREFSRPSARVIGEFPLFRKFRTKTLQTQSVSVTEEEKNRLDELLQFILEAGRVSRKSNYNGELSYLENFKNAENDSPIDYFLLSSEEDYDNIKAKIITVNNFEQGIENLPTQKLVTKSVDKMTETVASFLRLSSNITFVDPYFCHRNGMWKPMLAFLSKAKENSPTHQKHIQILFSGDNDKLPAPQFILSKMNDENSELIESFDSFKVIAIGEKNAGEKIHNRYMISELGALIWGIGLDENHSEVNDDVILLNDELYTKRYEQYAELSGFDVINYAEKN